MSYNATKTTTIRNADLSMSITADPELSFNEIAKGIRGAIKKAVGLRILPKATYSVRQHNSRTSRSIEISVVGLPFNILSRERIAEDLAGKPASIPWRSLDATFVEATLEAIAEAWNWHAHELSNYHVSIAVASTEPRDEERARIIREIEEARECAARAEPENNDNVEGKFEVCFF